MRSKRTMTWCCLLMLLGGAQLAAQAVPGSRIGGTVVNARDVPVPSAHVTITRAPDMQSRSVTTDTAGRFAFVNVGGSGEYLLAIFAAGYRPVRRRFLHDGATSAAMLRVVLVPLVTDLDAVRVVAARDAPPPPSGLAAGVGSRDGLADGSAAAAPPGSGAVLDLARTSITGVQGADGWSVAGLSGRESRTQLNGLQFSGSELPRSLPRRVRLSPGSYDVADGGFSGGLIGIDVPPADEFTTMQGTLTGAFRALPRAGAGDPAIGPEWTLDLGGSRRNGIGSRGLTYGARLARQAQPAATLANASETTLASFGADPAAARAAGQWLVTNVAGDANRIALPPAGWTLSALARVDPWIQQKDPSFFTVGVNAALRPVGAWSPLAVLPNGTREASTDALLQWARSVGAAGGARWDHSVGVSVSHARTTPSAGGLVDMKVGTMPSAGDTRFGAPISLGGHAGPSSADGATLEGRFERDAYLGRGTSHRLRLIGSGRVEVSREEHPAAGGVLLFSSLDALTQGMPQFLEVYQVEPSRQSVAANLATGLADEWRSEHGRIRLQAGARVDAGELTGPAIDGRIRRVVVSPRVGLSWRVQAPTEGDGFSTSPLFSRHLVPPGLVRIGAGVFQRALDPRDGFGGVWGPTGASSRQCGPGDITLDFDAIQPTPGILDDLCRVSGRSISSAVTSSTSADFTPPVSRRVTASYLTRLRRLDVELGGLWNAASHRFRLVDATAPAQPVSVLTGDGGRDFFSPDAAIDVGTGSVRGGLSSTIPGLRSAYVSRSDLQSRAFQGTLQISPRWADGARAFRLGYVWSYDRSLESGWDADVFGNPNKLTWRSGRRLPRHQLQVETGKSIGPAEVSLWIRRASGTTFFPLVAGDVNGDGNPANDRAWLPPLASAAPQLWADLEDFKGSTSSRVRECLDRARNSAASGPCHGPWQTQSALSVSFDLRLAKVRRGGRVAAHVENLAGLLGAVLPSGTGDQWGLIGAPNPMLLRPVGFDPAARAFTYAINPAFGNVRGSSRGYRISVFVDLPLSRPLVEQQVERWLRLRGIGQGVSRDTLAARFARNVPLFYDELLLESEPMLLDQRQASVIRVRRDDLAARLDARWRELAGRLVDLPADFDVSRAAAMVEALTDEAWEMSRIESHRLRDLLTPIQQELLPSTTRMLVRATGPIGQRIRYY